MDKDKFNVRGLLNFLSYRYGEKCYKGFDIFLIQTLHRKVKFDWAVHKRKRNDIIEILFDVMENKNYSEEVAERVSIQIQKFVEGMNGK